MAVELEEFAQELINDVQATAEAESVSTPDAFTLRTLEDLERAGEVENTFTAYYTNRGVEASGYGDNQSVDTLDVFISHFRLLPERLSRAKVEALVRRATGFVERCRNGLASQLDDATDERDMAEAVAKRLEGVATLRVFLLTNTVAAVSTLPDGRLRDCTVKYQVWDLRRLHRLATSGSLSEPIVVEFPEPLTCLATPRTSGDYAVMLAIMPGRTLAELYARYGTRLLELNVRSFLQARGSVNRGIRNTLLNEPDRFLAYNNGITATASQIDIVPDVSAESSSVGLRVKRLHDFQIVNGGQTTASLHYAHIRDRADLEGVFVQMKLTVVTADRLHDIVPEISRYSNTQNKVTVVDISSNHPYHIALERVTRSLWAPASDGGGQETRWFYERARGQYADALARERTPTAQKRFRVLQPPAQKFTKSDTAKYLNSWGQLPHIVSRGAEKNIYQFMSAMGDEPPRVDPDYCRRLIAKALLFKAVDRIVAARQFGGYKINITVYTVAKLAHATGRRVDLDRIWREQDLSHALRAGVNEIAGRVHDIIVHPPQRGTNVGEWTKRPECWAAVTAIDWIPEVVLETELVDVPADDLPANEYPRDYDVAAFHLLPAADWITLSDWARESQNLQPWERQIAESVARYLNNDWRPTKRMAEQAQRIVEEAWRLGFRASMDRGVQYPTDHTPTHQRDL